MSAYASLFQIYGDYGYESECLLNEFDTKKEAVDWYKNYVKFDLGGYDRIEVVRFNEDGEIVVVASTYADDEED